MYLERMTRLEKHRIGRIGKDRTKKSKVTRGRGKGYRICTRCASRTVRHVHLVLYDMYMLCMSVPDIKVLLRLYVARWK